MGDGAANERFAPPRPNGARVLLIDDDALALRQIGHILEQLGYRVLPASNWTQALRLFHGHDIDLVLMDAVMPAVGGFRLTQILRAQSTSYVPIITALRDPSAHARGLHAGADDFLRKPVDPLELRVRLTAMLRIRHLTRALEQKSRELARLAHVDPLTGLGNRRSFERELAREVERAQRFEHGLSLVMIDLDHFKAINDVHGHAAGDAVLSMFGVLLPELLRASDQAFRFGGEEFAILVPQTPPDQARVLAERVRATFAERTRKSGPCGVCTLSAGVGALAPIEGPDPAMTLIQRADQAVYRAKRRGRDRVIVYDDGPTPERAA